MSNMQPNTDKSRQSLGRSLLTWFLLLALLPLVLTAWLSYYQATDEFIKSYAWNSLVDTRLQDLVALSRHYDYIYDLFLIDSNGNIALHSGS